MGNFRQFGQRWLFINELFAVQISKFRTVEPDSEISSENSFPVLLVDAGEGIIQFTV